MNSPGTGAISTALNVAFVNQATDRVLPPIQNSLGVCTCGLGRALSASAGVTVYGRRGMHYGAAAEETHDGMRYRLLDAPRANRAIFRWYGRIAPWLRHVNHGMYPPASSSPLLFPFYTRAVVRDVSRHQYDVVHVQHSTQYTRGLKAHCPRSVVVVQLQAELFAQNNLRAIGRRLADVDLVLSPSAHITTRTRSQLPHLAERCETLRDGIDPREFPIAKNHHEHAKSRTIMFAGNISPHKGVHVLVDAFVRIAAAFPDTKLELVGAPFTVPMFETYPLDDHAQLAEVSPLYAGDYMAQLEQRVPAEFRDRVVITGSVTREDLLARFAAADVFAFAPIWDEGFGLPPVEAMAAGLPVVASRSGAVVETVVDGETGFLVPKNDAGALAAAIARLLNDKDLRAAMGDRGRRRALDEFSWQHAAKQALSLYEMALSRRGRASA